MALSSSPSTLSHIGSLPPPPPSVLLLRRRHHHHLFPTPLSAFPRRRSSTITSLSGGVSDDFVSTRKSSLDRGFSVIANMLKRIEPLDYSVISKGVSDSARDSMKQTISTMLGLLPSDQFSVTIRVSKVPLHRLLVSSIITGYTLWNAEYRISLMRNFEISSSSSKKKDALDGDERLQTKEKEFEVANGELMDEDACVEDLERRNLQIFGDLSPEALNYVQRLQSELYAVKEELNMHKQENRQIEFGKGSKNDLLEYLRTLDSEMVSELSRPSSSQVEEIIQQLVYRVLQRFFNDDTTPDLVGDVAVRKPQNHHDGNVESCIGTSRDYLAKLLFWCMLLGHHLRGLENRLQLSCVVGLL